MKNNFDLVVFLSARWIRFHRPGHLRALAKRLAPEGSKVLLVDRPDNLISSYAAKIMTYHKKLNINNNLKIISDNLFLFSPKVLLHDNIAPKLPGFSLINRLILKHDLLNILKELHFDINNLIVWLYTPQQLDYVRLLNDRLTVVEWYDDYKSVNGELGRSKRLRLKVQERKLLDLADIVLTTSRNLFIDKKQHNDDTYYTPNGVDYDFFAGVLKPDIKISTKLCHSERPIIGFLGNFNAHEDFDLLCFLAENKQEWTIVCIGKENQKRYLRRLEAYRRLKSMPNVVTLGWMESVELLEVCKAFDVCIIPFRTDSTYNKFRCPNKVNEYLAMGKPVVSTDIPEIRRFKDVVYIAKDKENFVALVERAIEEDNTELIHKRMRVAKENSWDNRAEEVVQIIHNHLGKIQEN